MNAQMTVLDDIPQLAFDGDPEHEDDNSFCSWDSEFRDATVQAIYITGHRGLDSSLIHW